MTTKALEARFEHLTVNDENDPPKNGNAYHKSKVSESNFPALMYKADLYRRDLFRQRFRFQAWAVHRTS